jgi:hypothetical protein
MDLQRSQDVHMNSKQISPSGRGSNTLKETPGGINKIRGSSDRKKGIKEIGRHKGDSISAQRGHRRKVETRIMTLSGIAQVKSDGVGGIHAKGSATPAGIPFGAL